MNDPDTRFARQLGSVHASPAALFAEAVSIGDEAGNEPVPASMTWARKPRR